MERERGVYKPGHGHSLLSSLDDSSQDTLPLHFLNNVFFTDFSIHISQIFAIAAENVHFHQPAILHADGRVQQHQPVHRQKHDHQPRGPQFRPQRPGHAGQHEDLPAQHDDG